MENTQNASCEVNITEQVSLDHLSPAATAGSNIRFWWKKLRGGFFLVIGFLLSPMSWWNDLFFNLPVAYGFGYLCSLLSPQLLLPCAIAGYWLSNIAGIVLMQVGAVDVFQKESQQGNLKKDLLMGLASSTVYTLVILALIQLKILDTPNLFPGS